MKILSINIPTYERFDSFSAIMIELENDLNQLLKEYKNLVKIKVIDNNSSSSINKKNLCENILIRSEIDISFSANANNIGGDRNILKCCNENPDAKFTWVLGDDDHIISGCIPKILTILLEHEKNLGLLILTGDYDCKPTLKDKIFVSYEQFARLAINEQPHLLIAHTLISCNIFRTDSFDTEEANYVLNEVTPRAGLKANFVHMRGMIKGLFRHRNSYTVLTPSFPSLDTSKRLPSEFDLGSEMARIYYFYFLWLLVELGINIKTIPRDEAMWWLF